MIANTQGIVLSHLAYKETSIIVNVYTRNFGYQGFVVNGIRSSKSKQSMAYFQPFTVLDLVVYQRPNRNLNRISEYKCLTSWEGESVKKQTVLLFLAEVVNKLVRNEHEENRELFDYLIGTLSFFKELTTQENFHLRLLLGLASHLGILVGSGSELFENMNRISDQEDLESFITELATTTFDNQVESNGEMRSRALETLMMYFKHHVPNFGEVHSLNVLRQIFR